MPGPFPHLPLIPPQNIHPIFHCHLWEIQSAEKTSDKPMRLVHHCLLWYPGCTQLSSVQKTSSHCSLDHVLCSSAHAKRSFWFFGEIGGFLLLIALVYPSLWSAVLIAYDPQFHSSHFGSSGQGMSRVNEDCVTHCTRYLRRGVLRRVLL
jgi:hypothetical protein